MRMVQGIIVLVIFATGIILAVRPLQDSQWADSVRKKNKEPHAPQAPIESNSETAEASDSIDRRQRKIPGGLIYVLPFVKEAVMMGVPALITLGILALLRRRKRRRKGNQATIPSIT